MQNLNHNTMHIAMYPWFAMGHLTSFLHLANKIAERGHKISFFVPTKTQPKLASHNHHPHLITFIPITVPAVDGLPAGAETTNDVLPAARPKIMEAMDLTKDTIDSHLAQLKPNYVCFDFTQWLPKLARKHGVTSIYYATTYMVSLAYFSHEGRNLPANHVLTKEDLHNFPPDFPCPGMTLQGHEARHLAYVAQMEFGGGMKLMDRLHICFEDCDVLAVKTCREMEGAYCDYVAKHRHKPIFLVGPVVPKPSSARLDQELDGWLNGFGRGSVVYCALGSECVLEKQKFQELILGLELTGRPFLAALKPPKGCETIESALPEGYSKRINGRGMVDGGWVQQQLLLHHPSVGGFITHCGAGSLSEAMLSECQLVLLPQATDQFINARLMSLDLRVGVEVKKRDDDGYFTSEDVCEAVHMAMDPTSEVGREMRANHTKWRNVLLTPGLEDSYIDRFVTSLQKLLG